MKHSASEQEGAAKHDVDRVESKGILKQRKDSIKSSGPKLVAKWDESNIAETYHPLNKTYGFQKVDEPPTPFERSQPSSEDVSVDPSDLASRLARLSTKDEKNYLRTKPSDDAQAKAMSFEKKRKQHYDEFFAASKSKTTKGAEDDEETDG